MRTLPIAANFQGDDQFSGSLGSAEGWGTSTLFRGASSFNKVMDTDISHDLSARQDLYVELSLQLVERLAKLLISNASLKIGLRFSRFRHSSSPSRRFRASVATASYSKRVAAKIGTSSKGHKSKKVASTCLK
jgi:hypothetical protein